VGACTRAGWLILAAAQSISRSPLVCAPFVAAQPILLLAADISGVATVTLVFGNASRKYENGKHLMYPV
jgi:hypothetical protein